MSDELSTLDPTDRAHHARVCHRLEIAQAVANSWGEFLMEKYSLAATDSVRPDGVIVRTPAADASAA